MGWVEINCKKQDCLIRNKTGESGSNRILNETKTDVGVLMFDGKFCNVKTITDVKRNKGDI